MPLLLDLIRHGEAGPAGPEGDRERSLSPAGEEVVRKLAARLARERWRPDHLFSSPLRRARQTAEILAQVAMNEVTVNQLEALSPEHHPDSLLETLAMHGANDGHVVLVGHQPLLGRLATLLTGTESGVRPGGLMRIECPSGAGPGAGSMILSIPPQG